MGVVIDTVGGYAVNPGSTAYAAATAANGDAFQVRVFDTQQRATLHALIRGGATKGSVRITSPNFHDAVRGITFSTDVDPTNYEMPQETGQPLVPGDSLAVSLLGGTAETDVLAYRVYYENLPGAQARLASWADISSLIANIKPVEIDVTTNATAGQWEDTLIDSTEALLKASYDYAVLGYTTDTAVSVIGIKGAETSNYRVCGPGTDNTIITANYFVEESMKHGKPYIPIVSGVNQGAIYCSVLHHAASVTGKVQLILAQLSQKVSV